jgi:dolichyl-phosphate beta-glucosyltransferase
VKRTLARFAAVGSLVTAVDVLVFVLLWPLGAAIADAIAVTVAALASYALHRAVTFRNDPYERWLRQRRAFVSTAIVGGALDVALVAVAAAVGDLGLGGALVAKAFALALSGTVRWVLHRSVLFSIVRSEHMARPDRPAAPGELRASVVIPAYREADHIASTVAAVRAALVPLGDVEIVVVDDGSSDGTADAARAAGADQVVVQPVNRGKGAAVRAGVGVARGRTVVFTDADLAYTPDQIVGLVEAIEAGWDVVVGSRKHDATTTLVRARRLREVGGRVINWLSHVVLLGHYRDTQCGLKAFRSDAAGRIFELSRIDGFSFDIEVFAIVERLGLALTEVPVTVANTARSTVSVTGDAARLVRDLFRIRRWAREGAYLPGEDRATRGQ